MCHHSVGKDIFTFICIHANFICQALVNYDISLLGYCLQQHISLDETVTKLPLTSLTARVRPTHQASSLQADKEADGNYQQLTPMRNNYRPFRARCVYLACSLQNGALEKTPRRRLYRFCSSCRRWCYDREHQTVTECQARAANLCGSPKRGRFDTTIGVQSNPYNIL